MRWLLLLLLTGCATEVPEPVAPPAPPPVQVEPTVEVDVGIEGHGPVGDYHPTLPGPDEGERGLRRMDLDQLSASVARVTGGVAWVDNSGNDQFETFAATLGKPDYLDRTREDLSPSPLFQKFLGDAARVTCTTAVAGEASGEREAHLLGDVPIAARWADSQALIEANLRELLLDFHGVDLPEGDARLQPWAFLYESTEHTSDDPVEAWTAVCVALMTHPAFYTL